MLLADIEVNCFSFHFRSLSSSAWKQFTIAAMCSPWKLRIKESWREDLSGSLTRAQYEGRRRMEWKAKRRSVPSSRIIHSVKALNTIKTFWTSFVFRVCRFPSFHVRNVFIWWAEGLFRVICSQRLLEMKNQSTFWWYFVAWISGYLLWKRFHLPVCFSDFSLSFSVPKLQWEYSFSESPQCYKNIFHELLTHELSKAFGSCENFEKNTNSDLERLNDIASHMPATENKLQFRPDFHVFSRIIGIQFHIEVIFHLT